MKTPSLPSLCALLCLAFAPANAPADEAAPPLTLLDAVARALEHDPALALAGARTSIAAAELREAEARRLPYGSLGASAEYYQEPMLVAPFHGFTPDLLPDFDRTLLRSQLSVGYDLYTGGQRASQLDAGAARLAASEAGESDRRQRLLATVVRLYLRILELQDLLAAHARREDALQAESDRVERLFEVGRAARVDRLRIASAIAASAADRASLEAALDGSERELARITGLSPDDTRVARLSPVALADRPPPERDELVTRLLATNPALGEADQEVRAAEAAIGGFRSGHKPRVGLQGNYLGFGGGNWNFVGEWNVGAALRWSFWDGGQTSERIVRAEASHAAAREQRRLIEQGLLSRLDGALVDWREADARRSSLAVAEEGFAEVARIEALRLETGKGVQADFLDAEAVLLETRSRRTGAEHAALLAQVELARLAGVLDTTWLADHLETKP